MIKNKTLCKILSCCLLMAMVMFPLFSIRVHAAEYEIVFKAGAHGTINGNKEASYRLSSDDVFPDEPDIQATPPAVKVILLNIKEEMLMAMEE